MRGAKQSGMEFLLIPLLISSLFLMTLPFSRTTQQMLMRKFHLNNSSVGQWCALQVLPSMYNFSNTVRLTEGKLLVFSEDELLWMNHYPTRALTLHPVGAASAQNLIELKTTYRGATLETQLVLKVGAESMQVDQFGSEFKCK